MPNWTHEQKQAIYEEGSNILVSAGAGSGKTEVLSERALRKVKDGVNIDQILILTFTKAAAYEMMIRIRNKIAEAGFTEQVNRIEKSYITTFDSFALSIVKKYHDRINIVKEVSIIDENVIFLLKKQFLEEILEEYYQKPTPSFEKLITDFCLRDDRELKKYILSVNDKLDLMYDKNSYLEEYIENSYQTPKIEKRLEEFETILKNMIMQIKELLKQLELSLDQKQYMEYVTALEPLLNANHYDEMKKNLEITLPRLSKNSDQYLKQTKEKLKSLIEDIQNMCTFSNKKEMLEGYLSTKEEVEVIIEIIQKLDQKLMAYKKQNSIFEFTDISKLAIELVSNHPDIQEELKSYFNEIMIDEYQDTSDLQEKLISLISNHNVYMVGDIKQSIYRFRNANPSIFKEKYNRYSKGEDGKKIDLNQNFRSREEVLEDINSIFNEIMDNDFGGANYQESHNMIFGNQVYIEKGKTNQNSSLEIYCYHQEKDSPYISYHKEEIEAFIIVSDMQKKVKDHYQVYDKELKRLRDVCYSDFVILIDRSSKFVTYKKIFEYLKIPLTILKDENIIDQNEVYLIRNILKLLSSIEKQDYGNTFQYSFISLARSYLFSYSDQEIFHIMKNNLYENTSVIEKINKIRKKLDYLDLYSLLENIIQEFEFETKLIEIGNIQTGISVLEYFKNLSINLQNLGYDYQQFITYLDGIIQSEKEINIPISIQNENSCRIMTIHKSKGLEYPICYYSGLSSSFNVSDLKEKIVFDNEYGMILPSFQNGYQDTFYKTLLKKKYYLDEISEKIRLFYVALTRCKEKMIIVTDLEEKESLEEKSVSSFEKEKYRSFLDILKSIATKIENKIVKVDLDKMILTKEYKNLNQKKIEDIAVQNNCIVSEYHIQEKIIEDFHFSKKVTHLISSKEKENMQLGIKIHELLEIVDFKNPELQKLEITDIEKKYLEAFLNQPILKNIQEANILKEYEFYTMDENHQKKHGIIDLVLEYQDRIDIIDYKLKNIEDIEYKKQLMGYQSYMEKKCKKRVDIYLYSIMDQTLKKMNSMENTISI